MEKDFDFLCCSDTMVGNGIKAERVSFLRMNIIRLQRRGPKNDPSFRVVVVDSKSAAKSGSYHEMLGSYDPRSDRVELNAERITHWMEHGAQVSDTVHNLLVSQKIITAKKRNVLPKKVVPVTKEESAETPVASAVEETPSTATEESAVASEAVAQ